MKNYYEILEVNKNASREVIDKAYKVLIKKYHPDQYLGNEKILAEQKTQEVNEAYHVLSDEFLRSQYNFELKKAEIKDFEKIYKEENIQKENYENENQNKTSNVEKKTKKRKKIEKEQNRNRVGTLMGIFDVLKEIFKNKPDFSEKKKLDKKDIQAMIITAVIVIILGIVMWFVPATNTFMRQLFFMS